jgi:hypothetical protein
MSLSFVRMHYRTLSLFAFQVFELGMSAVLITVNCCTVALCAGSNFCAHRIERDVKEVHSVLKAARANGTPLNLAMYNAAITVMAHNR